MANKLRRIKATNRLPCMVTGDMLRGIDAIAANMSKHHHVNVTRSDVVRIALEMFLTEKVPVK